MDEDPASRSAPYTTHVCERRGPPPRQAPRVPVFTQPGRGPQGVRPGEQQPSHSGHVLWPSSPASFQRPFHSGSPRQDPRTPLFSPSVVWKHVAVPRLLPNGGVPV